MGYNVPEPARRLNSPNAQTQEGIVALSYRLIVALAYGRILRLGMVFLKMEKLIKC